MRTNSKKLISLVLSLIMVFSLVVPAAATEAEDSTAKIDVHPTITLDKDSYLPGEEIKITVSAKNNGTEAVDVQANFINTPQITTEKKHAAIGSIAAGSEVTKEITATAGDFSNINIPGIQKTMNIVFGDVFPLVYKIFATFNPDMDCEIITIGDLKAAIVVTISELETVDYTVSFDLNYEDAESVIPNQTVSTGGTAVKPEDPTREGYIFGGWYTDNETFENEFDFSTIIDADYVLYAKWTNEIEPITGSMQSVDVYSIVELSVDTYSGTATATISAPENCAVVVRFIEEEVYFSESYPANKQYINYGDTFAAHVVPAGCDMENVVCDINGYLPEYFVAEAILIDANGEPLCEPFSTIEHTVRYEEFESISVFDFEDDQTVLNFDVETENNFGVLDDSVKQITASEIIYDEENNIYYVSEPSEDLSLGDKIFMTDTVNDYLLRVKEINTADGYTVIIPADAEDEEYGFGLSDFYKFLKVDMEYEGITSSEPTTYFVGASRSITDVNINEEVSAGVNINPIQFETDHFSASGNVSGTITASLEIVYDLVLFGEDYFKCDYSFSTDLAAKISVHAKTGSDDDDIEEEKRELTLGKVKIPFGVTGLSAFADINALIEWELTGGLEFSGTIKTTHGYKYNTNDGKQKIDQKSSSWTIDCKGHAEISFGPKPSVGVKFLDGVVSISLEAFFGAKAEADVVVPTFQGGAEKHACYTCLDGEVKACVTVDVYLKYKITEHLKGTPIDLNIVTYEKPLFDFYVSLLNASDSMFGGKLHADKGSCPNKEYRVSFNALNSNNESVTVDVQVYNNAGSLRATVSSSDNIYLAPGNYTAKATIEDTACSKSFNVSDGEKFVTLKVNNEAGFVNGSVLDVETREPLSGATIEVYEYTTLVASAVSDSSGAYSIPLEEGTYKLVVSKEDYVSATQYFTLRDGENKYLDSLLMAEEEEDSLMGGIYGTIRDAVTGYTVPDVEVKISRGWGNESVTETYVEQKITNGSGVYSCKKWSLFGVDFGLDAGNYTVIISKPGYITTSFNVTIAAGEDLEFNSTITPVGAENVYHIVLTWGSTPSDLDSHFNGTYNGSRDHVYFSDKYGYASDLDVDDTSSYGPETITITDISAYTGNVMYSVHDYTNRYYDSSDRLSMSNAAVKVYRGGQLLETFYVPSGVSGTVWNVFYIDTENNNIVPVNSFSFISTPSEVYGSTY